MIISYGISHQARQARLVQGVRRAPLALVEPQAIQDHLDPKAPRARIRVGGAPADFPTGPPWIPLGVAIQGVVVRNGQVISMSKAHHHHPLQPRHRKHFE